MLVFAVYAHAAFIVHADISGDKREHALDVGCQAVARIRQGTLGSKTVRHTGEVAGGPGVEAIGQRTNKCEL